MHISDLFSGTGANRNLVECAADGRDDEFVIASPTKIEGVVHWPKMTSRRGGYLEVVEAS